jgi:peptidoglycan/xylan/chitin deacetylase (PgdA/CDA1 family)
MIAQRMESPSQNNNTLPTRTPTALHQSGCREARFPLLRSTLAELYYRATYRGRLWYEHRLAAAGRAPVSVLTFHRIADDQANRWTTRTRDFVNIVRWLKQRFELISLAELQRRVAGGFNALPAVSITFDDGYAVNCEDALPLLVEERIPCTYFVSSEAVLEGKPFVHDTNMGNYHLAPNTIEQLRYWSRAGIDIGAHTRTHPNLALITDREGLVEEIVASRDELQAALDYPIRYFAFPFGSPPNMSTEAFEVAQAAGFEGACSAYGGWNYPGDNPFHIRRRCVDGPPNRAKNWAIIDPIRERSLPHFDYPGKHQGEY